MSNAIPVDELAHGTVLAAAGIDALVVAIADGEFRYTCAHCSAPEVLEDLGPQAMTPAELETRLRGHLERRHEILEADIRFWDGREAAAEARERAAELTARSSSS